MTGNLDPLAVVLGAPDTSQLAAVVMVAVFSMLATVVSILVGVKKLMTKREPLSVHEPLIVSLQEEFASKEELARLTHRLESYRQEMRGDMQEIKALIAGAVDKVEEYAQRSYEARKAIHGKLNKVDREVGSLDTRQQEQEKRMNGFSDLIRAGGGGA